MSNSNEGEGPRVINLDSSSNPPQKQMSEAEVMREQKRIQKQVAVELADYKKRLAASNEVKRLQVEELELANRYYHAKVEFRSLQPKMEELDAIEEAEAKEEKERQKKEYEAYFKKQNELEQAKKKEESKPDIIIPKIGKSRK